MTSSGSLRYPCWRRMASLNGTRGIGLYPCCRRTYSFHDNGGSSTKETPNSCFCSSIALKHILNCLEVFEFEVLATTYEDIPILFTLGCQRDVVGD